MRHHLQVQQELHRQERHLHGAKLTEHVAIKELISSQIILPQAKHLLQHIQALQLMDYSQIHRIAGSSRLYAVQEIHRPTT